MQITIIVAVAKNGVIGDSGKIPWKCAGDLAHFKNTTMGGICIFGRNTYDSLPRKPLPGRTNVVVSGTLPAGTQNDGSVVFNTLDGALAHFQDKENVFICGGAHLYRAALPYATKLIYTTIDCAPAGDTVFPTVNWNEWRKVRTTNGSGFIITEYVRRQSATK